MFVDINLIGYVFIIMPMYWNSEKNRALLNLIKAVLTVKKYFYLPCVDLNSKSATALSEIHGSKKYKTQNVEWNSLMMKINTIKYSHSL